MRHWKGIIVLHFFQHYRYNKLFQFLLTVKRIQMELQHAYSLLKCNKQSLRLLFAMRAKMSFIVDNLQFYIHVDVIDSQFAHMQKLIQQSQDFEQIHKAHEDYLQTIGNQCFLHVKPIMNALYSMFYCCMQLCGMIRNSSSMQQDMSEYNKIGTVCNKMAFYSLAGI